MNALTTQMSKTRDVLFVCHDNARYSLVAEAMLRSHRVRNLRAFSAGLAPADKADTFALSALTLAGLGSVGLWPKHWDGFADPKHPMIDVVIMIGDETAEELPRTFPSNPEYIVWPFSGDTSKRFHHGVWRDIQTLRPLVEELAYELRAEIIAERSEELAEAAE